MHSWFLILRSVLINHQFLVLFPLGFSKNTVSIHSYAVTDIVILSLSSGQFRDVRKESAISLPPLLTKST